MMTYLKQSNLSPNWATYYTIVCGPKFLYYRRPKFQKSLLHRGQKYIYFVLPDWSSDSSLHEKLRVHEPPSGSGHAPPGLFKHSQ